MVSANSSTSAGGLASAATGMRPTRNGAIHAIASMSRRTESRDLRPLHLDDDLLAAAQRAPRAPARSTRRRGTARRSARRRCSSGAPRSSSTTRRTTANGSGRHLVAAALELLDQLVREEALARRHDLAELDVRRAEPLEGAAQPARQAGARRRRRPCAARAAASPRSAHADQRRRLGEAPQRRQHAAPDQLGHLGLRAPRAARRRRRARAAAPDRPAHGPWSLKAPKARSDGGDTSTPRSYRSWRRAANRPGPRAVPRPPLWPFARAGYRAGRWCGPGDASASARAGRTSRASRP